MLLLLLHKVVEVMMVLSFRLNKAAAELEDANIRAVIVEAEHVRCVDMDANALADVQEDASVLLALAAQENVSAVLKDAMVVGANVKVF
jgi:hypothetical protein